MGFTWGGLADSQSGLDEQRPPRHAKSHHSTVEVVGYEKRGIGPDDTAGDITLISTLLTEKFSGGIEGIGHADHVRAMNRDGTGVFAGVERVTGTIDGRSGSFALTCHGTNPTADAVTGTWVVIPGSGTGELAGLRGRGEFTARLSPDGTWRAKDSFSHWFE
jgi:hypothetical protein